MIVYVTRWALTKGIVENEVDESNPESYPREQWYRTREEAIKVARSMQVKRIRSLQRQITKLANMDLG